MITVHISPSAQTISIEHLPQGNFTLTPEEAWSVFQRLKERQTEIYDMVLQRQKSKNMGETEVHEAIAALLKRLPAGYPEGTFTKGTKGYQLEIDNTIIFRDAIPEDAITHTKNYVEARERIPGLPVGVIYGIYD